MPQADAITRLTIGEGAIGAATRRSNGEQVNEQRIAQLEADLRGEAYYAPLPEGVFVPFGCVDGRLGGPLGPNAAGGTFTLVMADALTYNTHRTGHDQAPDHARQVYQWLTVEKKQRIGGHDDTHAHGANCGCGAQDKLDNANPEQPSILGYLERRSDDIRTVMSDLGIPVSADLHNHIIGQIHNLRAEHYATNGYELKQAFLDVADDSVATLQGVHNEVAVVINMRPGTTLDRGALAADYGDAYEVFNVDAWALKDACNAMSLTPEELQARFVAALYYNVATAAVLADSSLRVVVRQ